MANFDGKDIMASDIGKKRQLYYKQKELLDTFLSHGAISQSQYDKSLNCLKEKLLFGEDKD